MDEFWECMDEDWPVWFVCTFDTVRSGNEPFMDPKEFPAGWASFIDRRVPQERSAQCIGQERNRQQVRGRSARRSTHSVATRCRAPRWAASPSSCGVALHFLYPEQYTQVAVGQDVARRQRQRLRARDRRHSTGREESSTRLAPYVVRRLRSEVLPQLPAAQWIDVMCDMTPKQAKQYAEFAAKCRSYH
jgi:hypothetical protein